MAQITVECECGQSFTAEAALPGQESHVGKLINECRRNHNLTQAQWTNAHLSIQAAKERAAKAAKANTSAPTVTR